MRISDWSSDVCSSDLEKGSVTGTGQHHAPGFAKEDPEHDQPQRQARKNRPSRSEERRVGKECVRTCISRRSPAHDKKHAAAKDKQLYEENNCGHSPSATE